MSDDEIELMRMAWHELNAIRARDGAPPGVHEGYFDQLVTTLAAYLGQAAKPWPWAHCTLLVGEMTEYGGPEAAAGGEGAGAGVMDWQPIETAPTRTRVLVFAPPDRIDVAAWFEAEGDARAFWQIDLPHDWCGGETTPTHWMPLPEPPEAAA